MSLRVAVQMDPIETVNIAGDSSFALMLAAQARDEVPSRKDARHARAARFTWDAHARDLMAIYEDVLAGRRQCWIDCGRDEEGPTLGLSGPCVHLEDLVGIPGLPEESRVLGAEGG